MKRPFDDEENESVERHVWRGGSVKRTEEEAYLEEDDEEEEPRPRRHADAQEEEEDEEDPLDAFMADMAATKEDTTTKGQRADVDGEEDGDDHVHSYIKMMADRGIDVTDADVMARRREREEEEEYSDKEEPKVKKDVEPLPRVNHDDIDYEPFEKDFFEPHEDVLALREEEIAKIRHELTMHVTGYKPPPPGLSWAHFGFGDMLMQAIAKTGWSTPTGVQQQAIPTALQGRDILAIAKTGSGKTAAYILPLMVHCMGQRAIEKGEGPIGLILAPTRELAVQIMNECKKLGKVYGIRSSVLYGGVDKTAQFKELRHGCEILIATPGRLIDLVKMKATNLRRVTYLVLDEADRMFDLGFEPQVQSICDAIRPSRQTLLFSATLPNRVGYLAHRALTDPIKIVIGQVGQANSDVHQRIHIVPSHEYKYGWLTDHLPAFLAAGTLIIFVSRKEGVDGLTASLVAANYPVGGMHGDMAQGERDRVMRRFKKGELKILVATDIAARGLDIKHVRTVINYDIARDIDSHIHRVGRTGRAGEQGDAYTLLTETEDKFAGDLVRSLEAAGDQMIPDDLMRLAMRNYRFRAQREGHGQGRRGKGGLGYQGPPRQLSSNAAVPFQRGHV